MSQSTPKSDGHSIARSTDGRAFCSCGEHFPTSLGAMAHALPLSIARLDDEIRADPNSTPDLIARSADLRARIADLNTPERET